MKKVSLPLIMFMVTAFLTNQVVAVEFSIDSNEEIVPGDSFHIEIESSETQVHDVKAFFKQGSETLDSEIMSEGSWRNSYYYLKAAFPENYRYDLRLKASVFPEIELCVRLRKQGQTSFSEQCKSLVVVPKDMISDNREMEYEREKEGNVSLETIQKSEKKNATIREDPIILRTEQKPQKTYTTEGKTRIFINYLLAFIAIIALFLVLRKSNREL